MTNSSLTTDSSNTPNTQMIQGITEIRQITIAAMIARGFSVKYVAKKLKMSESRIYHLLSDRDSLVNAEIKRIFNELFASADRHLINLYNKTLQKLDAMLSSSDEETQCRAIDRIIKIYLTRSTKNAVTIQQYFGIQSKEEDEEEEQKRFTKRIEDLILKRSKERGLPVPTVEKRSSDQIQKDSSDSSPDDSSPDDSSQGDSSLDNFSTEDYTLDDSANASSPNDSFPDPSSPAFQEFLEKMK